MMVRQAILESAGPSHCVVQFDCDECVATVACKQVVGPPVPVVGRECWVNWNGEDYSAKVLVMGDSATAKQAEAEILRKLDDQTGKSSDSEEECSPPPKKRWLGFRKKVKDTKKASSSGNKGAKRKNTKQPAQKSKSKPNTFSFDLGSPAKVLTSTSCQASTVAGVDGSTSSPPPPPPETGLLLPKHPPPVIAHQSTSLYISSSSSFSSSDNDDDVIKDAYRRKVITIEDSSYAAEENSSSGKKCNCLGEVMEVLSNISASVSLLEQKVSLLIEKQLKLALHKIEEMQGKQKSLECELLHLMRREITKKSLPLMPAQPVRPAQPGGV